MYASEAMSSTQRRLLTVSFWRYRLTLVELRRTPTQRPGRRLIAMEIVFCELASTTEISRIESVSQKGAVDSFR